MRKTWQKALQRWQEAGLLDSEAAGRITEYEATKEQEGGVRWPAIVMWSFGGLMLGSGVLLFVAAHWDTLSPSGRFTLVLTTVAVIHLVATFVGTRQPLLGRILHAVGTLALGAAVFLVGQIFHLQEHWPTGFLLWALGAWIAWALLRDWLQLALAAALTPFWLVTEWTVLTEMAQGSYAIAAQGVTLLAVAYFTALGVGKGNCFRWALSWFGGLILIPSTIFLAAEAHRPFPSAEKLSTGLSLVGWMVALGGPLLVAYLLRGKRFWPVIVAAIWGVMLANTYLWPLAQYALCALFSLFLVWWGFDEGRRERINMGVAGFGITLLFFYFSSVMDKLGRSLSLVSFGIVFLVLGWVLMRFRRNLLKRLEKVQS